MNLHIMPDNTYSKEFIEFINNNFDKRQHFFCIITNNENFVHLDNISNGNIIKVRINSGWKKLLSTNNKTIKQFINKSDKIFIHYLSSWAAYYINKYAKKRRLYWIIWGGDLYSYIGIKLYDEETLKIILTSKKKKVTELIKYFIAKKEQSERKNVIKRLDYICTPFKKDYEVVIQNYNTLAKYSNFIFKMPISMQELNTIKNVKENEYKVILLGNSADPNNNHVSILNYLKRYKNFPIKIICPLSYGNKVYADKVEEIGIKIFGNKFISMRDYISKSEYAQMLSQVDIAIMNQYRQQGFGNIIPLLYLGKKIYMNETSSYSYFIENGIEINTIKEFLCINDFEVIFSNEDCPQKQLKNRRILDKLFSDEMRINNYKELFSY
ncbi:TDP-N-acetylfucosamine:lipid II N-acetylfucosaminyltransferase [Aminipila sp.]|uniref:TDP-N-acetylfucosamine:lipid II N-acetylfucosaminyltransferase n=1 Tax=Aminipila sp. TaxID=2060095 RepID=UPI00289EDB97|nr:TDP-N-acetylfucosamine:lipid II N-acetylfucosaminyltransferase [Aminipila sp.]